ncbi:MAG: type I glutamate--ammonia ligase [bacterium]|nr:type I glutamate--ammonia ligase [bacterium]
MSKYTKQDIIRLVEEEDVEFIRLQFVDICGTLKNMAVTTSQLDKVLNNECLFDCGAIEGFAGAERPELYLYPDLDTFEIFPWRPQQGKVARFLCDVYTPEGEPFEGDSRKILKRVIEQAAQLGFDFDIGPECEFFLFDLDEHGGITTSTSEKGAYFDIGPIDAGENARREMILMLEDMGFEITSSFHADAPGQHEVDFKYDSVLQSADNIVTFKLVVRTVARRHGLHATFMPKPKTHAKGSGLHINMAMYKDGKDMFKGEEDGLSKEAKSFIAGILEHAKGMSLITNPIVNSYKRLVPGYEAPVYIGWSKQNQSPLIRIPTTKNGTRKIELRSPDCAANPYLALAVVLAAGLDGIKRNLEAPASITTDLRFVDEDVIKQMQIETLPGSLAEAIDAFEKDSYINEILGEHLATKYLQTKKKEWVSYTRHVSPWEIDEYLERI